MSHESGQRLPRRERTKPQFAASAPTRPDGPVDPLGEYLSYSRLRSFHDCPRKFFYKYIEKREGDESRLWVHSGKNFHEYLEKKLAPHEGAAFPHEALKAAPHGHRTRSATLAGNICAGAELLAVEREVRYTVGGVQVLGYLDLMYRKPDGTVVICDVKTGGSPKIHIEQLEMYAWFYLEEHARLRLEYQLVDRDEMVAWHVGAAQRAQLEDELLARANVIRSEREFPPIPGGQCSSCEFFDACPDAGKSRGKPKEQRLIQLTAAKSGAKRRAKEFGG